MTRGTDPATEALSEVDRLRSTLKKKKTAQVRASEERSLAKATALAWFNSHRKGLPPNATTPELENVDGLYRWILDASDRATSRTTYSAKLKSLRDALIVLRNVNLMAPAATETTTDMPPDRKSVV